MAEEETVEEATEPQGEEPDYKALYEAEKAHSRKWEKQAKANNSAADELTKAQEAGKTAEEQIADLKRRLDEKDKAEKRAKLAAGVAERKGIPVDVAGAARKLVGDYPKVPAIRLLLKLGKCISIK